MSINHLTKVYHDSESNSSSQQNKFFRVSKSFKFLAADISDSECSEEYDTDAFFQEQTFDDGPNPELDIGSDNKQLLLKWGKRRQETVGFNSEK